jgi:UDP-2,3-diacylglucosamine pyrophosphatase LpxH
LPGNHDEFLRQYYGTHFGGIEVVETAIHQAADGRRYLVLHGDVFDLVVKHARWLALLGDTAYDICPFRKSYPRVAMMQSGKDWCGDDSPGSLNSSS